MLQEYQIDAACGESSIAMVTKIKDVSLFELSFPKDFPHEDLQEKTLVFGNGCICLYPGLKINYNEASPIDGFYFSEMLNSGLEHNWIKDVQPIHCKEREHFEVSFKNGLTLCIEERGERCIDKWVENTGL